MTRIQLRRDTSSNWQTNNPTPSLGEPCYEIDTKKLKIGDGVTKYNDLQYFAGSGVTDAYTKAETDNLLDTKQDIITDLSTIRNSASLGATALQPGANISDLTNDSNYLVNNFSNLSSEGLDKLNQSKALTTGNVSTDADVYADVLKRAHSTFDKSKFEIVGSPTITDDGIASGFSNVNYIKKDIDFSNANSLKIQFNNVFIKNEVTNTNKAIFELQPTDSTSTFGIRVYKMADSSGLFGLLFPNADGTQIQKQAITELGKDEHISGFVEVKNNQITLSINSQEVSYDISNEQKARIFKAMTLSIGATTHSGSNQYVYNGSIDLKSFAIWSDGIPVFNGNKTGTDTFGEIEIPYTLSKTGSKIVDAAYRDRVQDVYEQYGTAMYYTLDEENQNFTLPMGEIYGMITKNKEEASYTLPPATADTLGGIKVGENLSITEDGVLNATGSTPSNMVTTNTEQTITGQKVFMNSFVSSDNTATTGNRVKISNNSIYLFPNAGNYAELNSKGLNLDGGLSKGGFTIDSGRGVSATIFGQKAREIRMYGNFVQYDDNSNVVGTILNTGNFSQLAPTKGLKYWTGTEADYTGLATKDADTLYRLTDTNTVYLGTIQLSN